MRLLTACLLSGLLLGCPRAPAPTAPAPAAPASPAPAGSAPSASPAPTEAPPARPRDAGPGGAPASGRLPSSGGTGERAAPGDAGATPDGAPLRTYHVRDNGVRCITYPCPHYDVSSREGGVEQVHEVDLSALGLDEARLREVQEALNGRGLTVRGRIVTRPRAGPAGDARVLVVEALEGPAR